MKLYFIVLFSYFGFLSNVLPSELEVGLLGTAAANFEIEDEGTLKHGVINSPIFPSNLGGEFNLFLGQSFGLDLGAGFNYGESDGIEFNYLVYRGGLGFRLRKLGFSFGYQKTSVDYEDEDEGEKFDFSGSGAYGRVTIPIYKKIKLGYTYHQIDQDEITGNSQTFSLLMSVPF